MGHPLKSIWGPPSFLPYIHLYWEWNLGPCTWWASTLPLNYSAWTLSELLTKTWDLICINYFLLWESFLRETGGKKQFILIPSKSWILCNSPEFCSNFLNSFFKSIPLFLNFIKGSYKKHFSTFYLEIFLVVFLKSLGTQSLLFSILL